MKFHLIDGNTTTNYTFNVNHKGKEYHVIVFVDNDGYKFVDSVISLHNGMELDYKGTEGQIREDIIDYVHEHWDNLV